MCKCIIWIVGLAKIPCSKCTPEWWEQHTTHKYMVQKHQKKHKCANLYKISKCRSNFVTYEAKSISNIRTNPRRGYKPKPPRGVPSPDFVVVFGVKLQFWLIKLHIQFDSNTKNAGQPISGKYLPLNCQWCNDECIQKCNWSTCKWEQLLEHFFWDWYYFPPSKSLYLNPVHLEWPKRQSHPYPHDLLELYAPSVITALKI